MGESILPIHHGGTGAQTAAGVKTNMGLGNVQNYGIATQAEAEAGAADDKYMTPLKVAQAISSLNDKVIIDSSPVTRGSWDPVTEDVWFGVSGGCPAGTEAVIVLTNINVDVTSSDFIVRLSARPKGTIWDAEQLKFVYYRERTASSVSQFVQHACVSVIPTDTNGDFDVYANLGGSIGSTAHVLMKRLGYILQ